MSFSRILLIAAAFILIGILPVHAKDMIVKEPPKSLSKYYPPESKQPKWIQQMHKVSTHFGGVFVNLKEKDFENVDMHADNLVEEYKKTFEMVPEKVTAIFEKLPIVLVATSYIAENNIPLLNAMNKAVKELANQSHQKVITMIHNEYKFLAILFIMGTGLGVFIIRAITVPLKEVSEKVDQVSMGMILQDQIEVGNRDEVGRIRNSFNRLIDSLTHLIKLLDGFTGGDYSNASQLRRGDIEKAIFRLVASKNL